jgi:hypothetical protein
MRTRDLITGEVRNETPSERATRRAAGAAAIAALAERRVAWDELGAMVKEYSDAEAVPVSAAEQVSAPTGLAVGAPVVAETVVHLPE